VTIAMPIARRKAVVLAVLALVAGPILLGAQGAPSDTMQRDTLRPYVLAPLVVTASRIPAAAQQLGFATSVLDRKALDVEPTPYATRALTFLPGVSIDEASGPGGPMWLHLRGGDEAFTQIMFDGVPINISGGYSDISGLLFTNVERIEIARGPLSALWGSSAMSGAVQFITREGRAGPPQFEVLAEGGRATEHGAQAHSELTVIGGTDRWRYSSGVGFAYDRGIYALPNDLLTTDASLRLDATPAGRWTLTATARYMASQANLPVRDPGATRVPLDPNQRDRHYRWLGSVSTGWAATPTSHHRLTVSALWDDFVYQDARDTLLNPGSYPFFVANYTLHFRSTLLRPSVEYVGSTELSLGHAGSQLAVSYGAGWQTEAEANSQAGDFGPSTTQFGRANAAVFSELQGRLGPRLSVLTGARLEKFQGLPAELLPRASLVVALIPDRLAVRAAAGRAFKVPNLDQQLLDNPATIPNPGLRPESSASWEFGASVTAPRRALTLSVGYFHQRYNDLIQTVPADTGPKQTNKNLGRTQAVGVEIELERRWSERWRSGANLTWVKTEVLDNAGLDSVDYPVGGSLPAVPRVTGNAYVAVDVASPFTTLARLTLVGRQTVFTERFAGARVTIDPYALLELGAQWHVRKALDVYTRLSNLLNTKYQTAYDRRGVPRSVVLGVRATH
jgi:vitamin B12 transporter